MDWTVTSNNQTIDLAAVPVQPVADLRSDIIEQCHKGSRPVAFFGHKQASSVRLFVILANDPRSELLVSSSVFAENEKTYPAISSEVPAFYLFEREFFEDTGIKPEGHPWLKPVRFHPSYRAGKDAWGRGFVHRQYHEVGTRYLAERSQRRGDD